MTSNIKKAATSNLLDTKRILDALGITFWLDYGTLLGAYRQKDFCKTDESDIDLGLWQKDIPKKDRIIEEFEKKGFAKSKNPHISSSRPFQLTFGRLGNRIDLFFRSIKGNICWHKWETYYRVAPLNWFTTLDRMDFYGHTFNVPSHTDEYLKLCYGNWKIPLTHGEWNKSQTKKMVNIRDSKKPFLGPEKKD